MFIHFFCLCPLRLVNISKVAYLPEAVTRFTKMQREPPPSPTIDQLASHTRDGSCISQGVKNVVLVPLTCLRVLGLERSRAGALQYL